MAAWTFDPSNGAAWRSGCRTKICPGSPIPNSAALLVEVAVPSSSWVKAMIAPPGLSLVAPAMVSLGQLGDPTAKASAATTTKRTTDRIGYFQKTWRTRRSGGRSLAWVGMALSAGFCCVCSTGVFAGCVFSSSAMILFLLLLVRQRLAESHDPYQHNVR